MMRRVRIVMMTLLMLFSSYLNIPFIGSAAAYADTNYIFPDKCKLELDSRYVKVDVDKLDACLYAFLNANGEIEFRILAETNQAEPVTKLLKATIQEAAVYDEDQPDILITVHPDELSDEEPFCKELPEGLSQTVVDGTLVVDTPVGKITIDVGDIIPKPEAKEPAVTQNNDAAKQTVKPSATQSPAATPAPSVDYTGYECKVCGASFPNVDAWYQHAYVNPGHYNTAPNPTPTPAPSGHWETRWVVDTPAVIHDEWVCNVCGARFVSSAEHTQHDKNHALAGEGSGWHVDTIIDVPEQGHWEDIWVEDP